MKDQKPQATPYGPIELANIQPRPDNHRTIVHTHPRFKELVRSIKEAGVLEPVLLRVLANGRYELMAGARRCAAAKAAGLSEVPAVVFEPCSDAQAAAIMNAENLQREELTVLEEAANVAALLNDKWDVDAVAAIVGKDRSWVYKRAQLLRLTKRWQKAMKDPKSVVSSWTAAHLELVARLPQEVQDSFLTEAERYYFAEDRMTVSQLEHELASWTRTLGGAPFQLGDVTLNPAAGACTDCSKRAGCQPDLFDPGVSVSSSSYDVKKDRCLDQECFEKKCGAKAEQLAKNYAKNGETVVQLYEGSGSKEGREKNYRSVHAYVPAKATEKGAMFGVIFEGKGAGTGSWVKPRPIASSSSFGSPRQKGPKSLAQKKKELQFKRTVLALKMLKQQLEKTQVKDLPPASRALKRMAAVTAVFGNRNGQPLQWAHQWRTVAKSSSNAVVEKLWDRTKLNLLQELVVTRRGPEPPAAEIAHAKGLCDFTGLKLRDFEQRAEKQLPEPKSWAVQAKKPAKKRAKKKAKKGSKKRVAKKRARR